MSNRQGSKKSGKILLIDFEDQDRWFLNQLFSEIGYSVISSKCHEALGLIKTERVCLILIDLAKERQHGAELCKAIKLNKELNKIPLLFLSERNDQDIIQFGYDSGADDCICKPFIKAEIISRINTHLAVSSGKKQKRLQNETKTLELDELFYKYKTLYDTMELGLIYQDSATKIVDANEAAFRILNLSKLKDCDIYYIARNYEIFCEDGSPFSVNNLPALKALETGLPQRNVIIGIKKRGADKVKWLKINSIPQFKEGARIPYGVSSSFDDITELKELMKKYRTMALNAENNRSKLEAVFNAVKDGISVSDMTGKFLIVNRAQVEINGFSSMEEMEKNIEQFAKIYELYTLDGNIIPPSQWPISKVLRGESVSNWIIRGRRTDINREWYFSFSGEPVIEEDGRQTMCVIITRDITDRKKAELDLLKLSKAINQSPVSVVITNKNGIIEYVNPKFTEITGYSAEDALGKENPILLTGNSIPEEIYSELINTISEGMEWKGELPNYNKDGNSFWENIIISPIKNSSDEITHFIYLGEDITIKKNMEINLKAAFEKAEESARLKSSLLANMSHEFRTPMVGILGLTSILKEKAVDPDDISMLDGVLSSAYRLMRTLDSVLELSYLESNLSVKKLEVINLNEAINAAITENTEKTKEKGLNLITEIKISDIFISANSKSIQIVISQLLDNAVKFTETGYIKIVLDAVQKEESGICAIISVIDTGIGIAPENHNLIFEDFRQVSEGISRGYEGSGIGLALVKKIVKLYGGHITLNSSLGSGTVFIIEFPVVKYMKINSEELNPDNSVELNYNYVEPKVPSEELPDILLVEDNVLNKNVVKNYLKECCNIDYAKNGLAAIKMAREKKYPVVLMDINLGVGMDGVAATKEIRKITGYESTPIVALTGYAMEEDRNHFLSEGLSHYMAKPFGKNEIYDLVTDILAKQR
jgi:PAS domain S-box-containing protein